MDLEVNEARLFSIGGEPLRWWLDFRHRYEPIGRVQIVTASMGGDLLRVKCDDREHAEWLLDHAVQQGIPKSAVKVKPLRKER
jgi:hypothetical protein